MNSCAGTCESNIRYRLIRQIVWFRVARNDGLPCYLKIDRYSRLLPRRDSFRNKFFHKSHSLFIGTYCFTMPELFVYKMNSIRLHQ